MSITYAPIGFVENDARQVPRHWTVSSQEGVLAISPPYERGLSDLVPGQRIVVVFHFHRSSSFSEADLRQTKRGTETVKGVFSICSPLRPNAIGLSVVEILGIDGGRIRVRGLDMIDGTPILDIKPHIEQ